LLREFLHKTSSDLFSGRPDTYKDNPIAISIRNEGRSIIESYVPEIYKDYKVEGSAGRGQFADIPWISIYNLSVTDRASQGYYVVYLIPSSSNKIILGLAQSYEEAQKEFGKESLLALDKQAELMRLKIPEYSQIFLSSIPEIEIKGRLNYRNGHVYHIEYDSSNLPREEDLIKDLDNMLNAYETLFYRGGRDSDNFSITEEKGLEISIKEQYRIKAHYSIERPSNNKIKKIKQKLGYTCNVCKFNFEKTYGDIGKDYIEAHHLIPISSLEKGKSRFVSEKDFAVLCSNCHKMIHKYSDSSNLDTLIGIVKRLNNI